ncbi:MAG TPA: hypothetical protein ENI45_03955 [Thermoplasmatales archaeon]|nr:hypothetical protein [Thermoplasmatales archaeon]
MEIKVLKEKTRELEIEVEGEDETILNPIKEKLLQHDEVAYVECTREHPLLSKPRLYLKVREGKAKEILMKTLTELQNEMKRFREQIEKKK